MKKLIIGVLAALCLASGAEAQSSYRGRWHKNSDVVAADPNPTVTITGPTTGSTISVSTAAQTVTVVATDDVAITSLSGSCIGCVSSCGAMTISGTTDIVSSCAITLTCSAGAGSLNTVTITANDADAATPAATDVLPFTCVTPDAGSPTITITTPSSTSFSTSAFFTDVAFTISDDVGVTQVLCNSDVLTPLVEATLQRADKNSPYTSGSARVGYKDGTQTVTCTAYDDTGNTATDTYTVTQQTALYNASSIMPKGRVGEAYSFQLTAAGGTGSGTGGGAPYTYSYSIVSGTLPSGLTRTGDVISGTPDPGTEGTYNFVFRVSDGTTTDDTPTVPLVIVAASAEGPHDYFNYQVNTGDAALPRRQKCTGTGDITDGDCIIQIPDCPDTLFSTNGACSFRSASELNRLNSRAGLGTEATLEQFQYVFSSDTYRYKQDAAKFIIPGWTSAAADAHDGIGCNDPDTAGADDSAGCTGIATESQLSLDMGAQQTGTITYIIDDWYGPEMRSSGNAGGFASGVSNCGGALGGRQRWKQYRVDSEGNAHYWALAKTDMEQAHAPGYFLSGGGDTEGFWDCDDGVISGVYSGSQKSVTSYNSKSCPNCAAGVHITPDDIGLINNDANFRPNGEGAFCLTSLCKDWPLKAYKWRRIIAHQKLRVPADSSVFDSFRTKCSAKGSTGFDSDGSAGSPGPLNSEDTTCAAMLNVITARNGTTSDSLWHALYVWMCDEDRGCQRILYGVPFHAGALNSTTGGFLNPQFFEIEFNASNSNCRNLCEDIPFYIRNAIIIKNINAADIDDTGCPTACIGDSGSVNSNVFRKPKR